MWLENLKELKKARGMTSQQIADATNIPVSTIKRIFAGETPDPYISTIHRIVTVLDGSLDEILADTGAVLAPRKLMENEIIAELKTLREKISAQETEILLLKEQLHSKEELIEVYKHFSVRRD